MKKQLTADTNRWADIGSSVLIAAVFVGLVCLEWMRWTDPITDFGAELYVPWQLHEGAVLYRDLASFKGPFSPSLNLLWFTLFGVSLRTLVWANLGILALVTAAITLFLRRCTDRLSATMGAILFVTECGLAKTTAYNMNFVTPFVHELTHGFTLSIFLLLVIQQLFKRPTVLLSILGGIVFGCILLTRVEMGVAALGMCGLAGIFLYRFPSKDLSPTRILSIFAAATCIPPVIALIFLSQHMPWQEAANGMIGSWKALLSTNVSTTYFFQRISGFTDPSSAIARTLIAFLLFLNWVIATVVIEKLCDTKQPTGQWLLLVGIALACFAGIAINPLPPLLIGRVFPLTVAIIFLYSFTHAWKKKQQTDLRLRFISFALLSFFAFLLLGKILLNARVTFYGFVHAAPALIVTVAALLWLLPNYLQSRGQPGTIVRRIVALALIVDALCFVKVSVEWSGKNSMVIGSGRDSFLVAKTQRLDPQIVNDLLQEIQTTVPQNATLAPVPEGLMMNYLTRRKNSIPYLNLMVTELSIFGEEKILQSFKNAPPDYIALLQRSTIDFGFAHFGDSEINGTSIRDWIKAHYQVVWSEGADPFASNDFGVKLLKRVK